MSEIKKITTKCSVTDVAKACFDGTGTGIINGVTSAVVGNTLSPVKINPVVAITGGAIIGGISGCVTSSYDKLKSCTDNNISDIKPIPKTTITSSMSKFNIVTNNITINENNTKIVKYLVNNGVSCNNINKVFDDTKVLGSIEAHLVDIQHYQEKLMEIKTNNGCVTTIKKGDKMFKSLTHLGSELNSPAITTIAQTGCLMMQLAELSEKSSGFVTNFITAGSVVSLFEPITMIANITIGLIGLFGSFGQNRNSSIYIMSNLKKLLREMTNSICTHIDSRVNELHSHLNVIHSDIIQIHGLVRQSLINQQNIYKLQYETFKLIKESFSILNNKIDDLSSGITKKLENISQDIQHLLEVGEMREMRQHREDIRKNVDIIKRFTSNQNKIQQKNTSNVLVLEKMSNLETILEIICTPEWNGLNEYYGIKNNVKQVNEYISRHNRSQDYCLAFLAEKYEEIMHKDLSSDGISINKNLLFSNVLWIELMISIINVANSKSLVNYNFEELFTTAETQVENAIKFITYLESNSADIFFEIKERNQQLLNNIQNVIYYEYFRRKDTYETNEYATIGTMFVDTLTKYFYELDNNFLVGKLFGLLIGDSTTNIKLTNSKSITDQKFVFKNQPMITNSVYDLMSAINYASSPMHCDCVDNIEFIGGKMVDTLYENIFNLKAPELIHINISNDRNIPGINSVNCILMEFSRFDTDTHKTKITHYDSRNICDISKNPVQLESVYKMINYRSNDFHFQKSLGSTATVPQVWASCHIYKKIIHVYEFNYFVLFSPGTGEVAMKNLDLGEDKNKTNDIWIECDNNNTPAKLIVSLCNDVVDAKNKTFQTCLTNIVGSYLKVNIFDWTKDPDHIEICTQSFDLDTRKWCGVNEKRYTISKTVVKSPNQLFVQNIKPYNISPYYSGDYVIGVLSIKDTKISKKVRLEMFYKESFKWSIILPITLSVNVDALDINQIRTEIIDYDDKKFLLIAVSIKSSCDGSKSRLVVLMADISNNEYKCQRAYKIYEYKHVLESINRLPDLQAMRTVIATIGPKQYLIIGLLDKDFKCNLFRFDPESKEFTFLSVGPKIMDNDGLSNIRSQLPGRYPIRNYEMNIAKTNGMLTLYFSFTSSSYSNNMFGKNLKIVPYNLTPIIFDNIKSVPIYVSSISSLKLSLIGCKILISQKRAEIARESMYVNELLVNEYKDVKRKIDLNIGLLKIYHDKIKIMDNYENLSEHIVDAFNVVNISSNEFAESLNEFDKNVCSKCVKVLKDSINTIDSFFKILSNDYTLTISINVNRMLDNTGKIEINLGTV